MKSPTHIEVAPAGTANELVEQELYFVRKDDRAALLKECLKEATGPILIFTRTKHGAGKVNKMVQGFGYRADEIHSNKSLAARKRALANFKSGASRVLVATDIAARGIDVKNISLVINFDIPENPDDYVHRIGRTGRAGATGKAITFAMPDQVRDVRDIERLVKKAINVGTLPQGIVDPKVNKLSTDGHGGGKRFHYKDRNFGRPQGDESRRDFGRRSNRPYRPAGGQGGAPRGGAEQGGGRREARGRKSFAPRSGGQGGYGGRRSGGSSARTGRSGGHRPGGRPQGRSGGRPSGRSSGGRGFSR